MVSEFDAASAELALAKKELESAEYHARKRPYGANEQARLKDARKRFDYACSARAWARRQQHGS